jgi:hypothetical protein
MIENGSPAGWVVMVMSATGGSGAPSFKYFNAAIANADKAVEETRKRPDSSPCMRVQTIRRLSAEDIERLGLASGEVKPA